MMSFILHKNNKKKNEKKNKQEWKIKKNNLAKSL